MVTPYISIAVGAHSLPATSNCTQLARVYSQMCGANGASKMSPDVRCEWCIQICQDVRCEWCGYSLPGGRPLKATDHQLSMDVAAKLLSDLRPIQSCFFVLATRTASERTTT